MLASVIHFVLGVFMMICCYQKKIEKNSFFCTVINYTHSLFIFRGIAFLDNAKKSLHSNLVRNDIFEFRKIVFFLLSIHYVFSAEIAIVLLEFYSFDFKFKMRICKNLNLCIPIIS